MSIITKGNNATNTSRTRIKPIWRGGFPGAGRRAHRTGITSIAFVYAFSRGPLSPVGAVPPVKRAIRRTLSCSFWRRLAHTGPQQIWIERFGLKTRPHCTHFFSSICSRKRRPHFSHFFCRKSHRGRVSTSGLCSMRHAPLGQRSAHLNAHSDCFGLFAMVLEYALV